MLFKCRVCAEKDKRIQDLLGQIADLRKLAIPDTSKISLVSLESDAVMSGHDEQIPIEIREDEALESSYERDRLLSGTYDVT